MFLKGINDAKQIAKIRRKTNRLEIVLENQENFGNNPEFWLKIIYDMEGFLDIALKLKEQVGRDFTFEEYKNILFNSKEGAKYIYSHLEEVFGLYEDFAKCLVEYEIYFDSSKEESDKVFYAANLHLRAKVILVMINYYPQIFFDFYTNIVDALKKKSGFEQLALFPYQAGEDEELMSEQDVSLIAQALFNKNEMELFSIVKEFIFANYPHCDIVYHLASNWVCPSKRILDELERDANRYFVKDSRMRFFIYNHYAEKLSAKNIQAFQYYLKVLKYVRNNYVNNVYFNGLAQELERCFDMCLSLSASETIGPVFYGTTCAAVKIGKYILKIVWQKYADNDNICPNLFLIIKNLEEHFALLNGKAAAGVEIQKFLEKSASYIDEKYLEWFKKDLRKLGYVCSDLSRKNLAILDSYQDADTENSDELPDWFKEVPLVLIDRDSVYKR